MAYDGNNLTWAHYHDQYNMQYQQQAVHQYYCSQQHHEQTAYPHNYNNITMPGDHYSPTTQLNFPNQYYASTTSCEMYDNVMPDVKPDPAQLIISQQQQQLQLQQVDTASYNLDMIEIDTSGQFFDHHDQSLSSSYFSDKSSVPYVSPGAYPQLLEVGDLHHFNLSKHICQICGDRASGKHYGVYSCEGCKGFFKRTVRKNLAYSCREERSCIVDKRQRNRCQYCRYAKCVSQGMKREAVQEERQKLKGSETESDEPDSTWINMPIERILEAEYAAEAALKNHIDISTSDAITNTTPQTGNKQLVSLVEWAKKIPYFTDLPVDDQVRLIKSGWFELLIAAFSHRSIACDNVMALGSGLHVSREAAGLIGALELFDQILIELVNKMKDLRIDSGELGCLKTIILFNPEVKGLTSTMEVEALRDSVYATLQDHTKTKYPGDVGRFAKLILKLPALRSIGIKALDYLSLMKLLGQAPTYEELLELLET